MLIMGSRLLFTSAIIIAAAIVSFGQTSSPKAVVRAFYTFDRTHSFLVDQREIESRKKWMSAELYRALLKELDRQKEFLAKNPTDKPYFGDGLPVRPLDEACQLNGREYFRKIYFGRTTVKGGLANVDVYFKYPKDCGIPDVLYAVNMSREKGRWVIDDIRDIADNSSLLEDLNRKEY